MSYLSDLEAAHWEQIAHHFEPRDRRGIELYCLPLVISQPAEDATSIGENEWNRKNKITWMF